MNEALKIIEAQLQLVATELRKLRDLPGTSNKVDDILRLAVLDAIALKAQVDLARAWHQSKK
jgi:hypothetical protein